mgnify:CR=1 FL=1|jgi:hypothetical protein
MKREGYTYDKTWKWNNLIEAEQASTKRKTKRHDVQKHIKHRIRNLCYIQQALIDKTIETGEYKHMKKISGQNKMRDIAKLRFHPSHIYHQALVVAGEKRIEKNLIYDTYASRKGKGQIAGALRVKQFLKEYPEETIWYGQGDIRKFYDSVTHPLLEKSLTRVFKDKAYISASMEPVHKFSQKGLPLGIRPSQMDGNLILSGFDHWAKEVMRMRFYIRYMDDFVVLCKTKGEVKRFMRASEKKLNEMQFITHVPKVHKIEKGLYFLGFGFHPGGEMFLKRTNKSAWLKRRSKVTNPKRLQEIDAAAWGMLKHGNKHCKRLYRMTKGVDLKKIGIVPKTEMMADGKKFFDVPRITASVVLNNEVDVLDWEKDVETSQGKGRWVLLIRFFDKKYRLIINSMRIKKFISMLEENKVTAFHSMLIDRTGNKHYDFDFDRTKILGISGHEVSEDSNGELVYQNDQSGI